MFLHRKHAAKQIDEAIREMQNKVGLLEGFKNNGMGWDKWDELELIESRAMIRSYEVFKYALGGDR